MGRQPQRSRGQILDGPGVLPPRSEKPNAAKRPVQAGGRSTSGPQGALRRSSTENRSEAEPGVTRRREPGCQELSHHVDSFFILARYGRKMQTQPMLGHTRNHTLAQGGFTLVELSIVLVIIALVAGVVLTGQSLIADASIRSTISQISKYREAVTIFRLKYNGLPGDLNNTRALSLGLSPKVSLGRDSNRLITTGSSWTPSQCAEANLFWNDLSTIGLIEGRYTGTDTNYGIAGCGSPTPRDLMPVLKRNNNVYVVAYSDFAENQNYFAFYSGITAIAGYGEYTGIGAAFTPMQAYSIDSKMDDGTPLGGQVTARYNADSPTNPPSVPAAPANGVCVSNATGNPYNTLPDSGGNTVACVIRIPM